MRRCPFCSHRHLFSSEQSVGDNRRRPNLALAVRGARTLMAINRARGVSTPERYVRLAALPIDHRRGA